MAQMPRCPGCLCALYICVLHPEDKCSCFCSLSPYLRSALSESLPSIRPWVSWHPSSSALFSWPSQADTPLSCIYLQPWTGFRQVCFPHPCCWWSGYSSPCTSWQERSWLSRCPPHRLRSRSCPKGSHPHFPEGRNICVPQPPHLDWCQASCPS